MKPKRPNILSPATELECLEIVQTAVVVSTRLLEMIPDAPLAVLQTLMDLLVSGHCVKIRVLPDGESWETEVVRGRVET